jgi:hypothetical protein
VRTRARRVVGLVILAVIVGGSGVYIWAVQNDYYGMPFNINPKPPPTVIPISVEYPSIGPLNLGETCVAAYMELETNGTLAAGTPVKIVSAGGLTASPFCFKYLQLVDLGFYEAYPVGQQFGSGTNIVGVFQGAHFGRNTSIPYLASDLVSYNYDTFEFPVPGDYSPTLLLSFYYPSNNTQYTFDGIKVHVASSADIQNDKNAKIQTALTYVIVAFIFLEGFSIVMELTEEKSQGSLKAPPTQATTIPDKKSPSPNT